MSAHKKNRVVFHLSLSILSCILLSSCLQISLYRLEQRDLKKSDFYTALAREYLSLSKKMKEEDEWGDARIFANKGLSASYPVEDVLPEHPKDWDIHEGVLPTLELARTQLMTIVHDKIKCDEPVLAAESYALYDCWVEQEEESGEYGATEHTYSCRDEFYNILHYLGTKTGKLQEESRGDPLMNRVENKKGSPKSLGTFYPKPSPPRPVSIVPTIAPKADALRPVTGVYGPPVGITAAEKKESDAVITPKPSVETLSTTATTASTASAPVALPAATATPTAPNEQWNYTVWYRSSDASLGEEAFAVLNLLAKKAKQLEQYSVVLSGYSTSSTKEEDDLVLSKERADLVRDALVERGLNQKNITIYAYGRGEGAVDQTAAEAGELAENRVDITLQRIVTQP